MIVNRQYVILYLATLQVYTLGAALPQIPNPIVATAATSVSVANIANAAVGAAGAVGVNTPSPNVPSALVSSLNKPSLSLTIPSVSVSSPSGLSLASVPAFNVPGAPRYA
jgi:hypothetical protein